MVFMFVVLQFLPFVVVPLVIVLISVKAVKNAKKNNSFSDFKNTISNANDKTDYWNSISSEDTSISCSYCGTNVLRVRKKCPNCGAKIEKIDSKK